MKTARCPACSGAGRLLGSIGWLEWFRCRNCGIDFHRTRRLGARRMPTVASAQNIDAPQLIDFG